MSTGAPLACRRAAVLSDLLQQKFDPDTAEANHRQLYRILQQAILSGELPAGTQLPPTRLLACDLGIARNTVIQVYEQLGIEGYVHTGVGRGTFVADTAPDRIAGFDLITAPARRGNDGGSLSCRGKVLLENAGAGKRQWGAFVPGVPDVTQFPARVWSRIESRLWRRLSPEMMSYASGGGYAPLREVLVDYLRTARGVRCDPRQVLITTGTHHSLHLLTHLLADFGDGVWLEEPGYWGARSLLQIAGLDITAVPVDEQGMNPGELPLRRVPRFIFVSPSHQFPLGSVMSLARRRELLEYAKSTNAWIVEDDYDSEFRYGCRPLPSLQGLDDGGRVIYLGTLSKIMFPGLRLAYMVVPENLVDGFALGLMELYREGHLAPQAVLAEFIREGHFASHIRRMRTIYSERRVTLIEAIHEHFGDALPVIGSAAGLHLVLGLPGDVDDQALSARALAHGIVARPLSLYYCDKRQARRGLVLGYGCVARDEIPREFARLATVIRECL